MKPNELDCQEQEADCFVVGIFNYFKRQAKFLECLNRNLVVMECFIKLQQNYCFHLCLMKILKIIGFIVRVNWGNLLIVTGLHWFMLATKCLKVS
jgi:hypothetical protein